jgi:hypothetical protein
VQFEVKAPAAIDALSCNCSICKMTGFLHLIVAAQDFKLLQGQEALTDYRFNTRAAAHLFCKICGIKSFYVPRSHPNGFSVNVNCLDPATFEEVNVTPFDGANWEANIHAIRD